MVAARWNRIALASLVVAATSGGALHGCATLGGDPLQVTVAGIEPMQGEGLEFRTLVKLRVQNPNDAQIDYDGAAVHLDVQGKTIASGVSDAVGTVPRFGEAIIAVPVTVSLLSIVGHAVGSAGTPLPEVIHFSLEGKLSGRGFATYRFKSQGDLSTGGATASTPDST